MSGRKHDTDPMRQRECWCGEGDCPECNNFRPAPPESRGAFKEVCLCIHANGLSDTHIAPCPLAKTRGAECACPCHTEDRDCGNCRAGRHNMTVRPVKRETGEGKP